MELKGKRVLVYGAGRSGIGAADLLARIGSRPVLYDEKADIDVDALRQKLAEPKSTEIMTGVYPEEMTGTLDALVLSPGVPCDLPVINRIREAGVPVLGEVELAYLQSRGLILAITGTNGKTTTTSLVGEIMASVNPDTHVVGNIGNAYTGEALKTSETSVIVAEISSFQLETIHEFRPHVSAILNITEDHLNRHHTMEEYIRVKELITCNQTEEDVCVLNHEDPVLREFGEKHCPARVFWFSSAEELEEGIFLCGGWICLRMNGKTVKLLETAKLMLPGVHNYENVMAAIAMCISAGVSPDEAVKAALSFKPVAHRIEFIAEKRGVVWYNDSKGTNPDAAIKGIRAMNRPTLLIAGGYDKGSSYDEWIEAFDGKVRYLVLIGQTREKIQAAAQRCGLADECIILCDDLKEAVQICHDKANPGDCVLLSPACASWGQFENYEQRGDLFKEYVRNL